MKYEGTIGSYKYVMKDDNAIEVWSDFDSDVPETYIFLKEGSIKNKKDFDYEIMWWHSKNIDLQ